VVVTCRAIEIEGEPQLFTTFKDITGALELQNKYFRTFENAATGIAHVSLEGAFLEVNQRWCDILGYSAKEMTTLTFQEITHPDDLGRDLSLLQQMVEGERQTFFTEKRYFHKEGSVVWVNLTVSLLRQSDGSPDFFISFIDDITQSKLAQQRLKQSEQRSKALISNMINGFALHEIVLDEAGKPVDYIFRDLNPSFINLTGLTKEACLGKRVTQVIKGIEEDSFDWIGKYGEVALTGQPISFEVYSDVLEKWFNINAYSPEKGMFATVFQDITTQKNHLSELEAAKLGAEQANQAKSDFISMMSHELRTPMNGVLGMAQLLLLGDIEEQYKEYCRIILSSGENLVNILSDILDLSKIEAGSQLVSLQPFGVSQLVDDVHRLFLPVASQKGIDFFFSILPEVPVSVVSDISMLRRILVNLVQNAIKFTDTGQVSIVVDCVQQGTTEQAIQFKIIDTGIGIPEEKQESIFKAFEQVDSGITRRYGGTGLGLTLVKELVSLLGGTLSLKSIAGEGSCFAIEIPVKGHDPVEERSEATELAFAAIEPEQGPQRRALLAEDDPTNQMVIVKMLQHFNITCDIANNGEEAVALASKQAYDLIFMDILMPKVDGYEATEKIRSSCELNKETKIIAMTAMASDGDQAKCFKVGMNEYISKPISMDLLMVAIALPG